MDQATLMDKIKTGTTLCKAIMRNGYDAYAINAPLQGLIFEKTGVFDVDIACACDTETLFKIFPNAVPYTEEGAMAMLQENGVTLRFYSTDVEDASHPEMSQLRITPRLARLLAELQLKGQLKSSNTNDPEAKEFEDFDKAGSVKLVGLPSKTLAKNYLLAIRALRYAANFDLPVNPHTWVSIIQSANRILDYVPARESWKNGARSPPNPCGSSCSSSLKPSFCTASCPKSPPCPALSKSATTTGTSKACLTTPSSA